MIMPVNQKIILEHRMSLPAVNVHNPLKIRSINSNKPVAYSTLRKRIEADSIESILRDDPEPT